MGLKVWVWLVSHRKDIFNIIELLIILYLIPMTWNQQRAYKHDIEECWNTTGITAGHVINWTTNMTDFLQNVTIPSSDTR
jgi:hypothetical protein